MDYYGQFQRRPTPAEIEQLATDYNEHYGTIDGATEARIGDESLNESLKLVQGNSYSRVDYSPATDSFFWIHALVLERTIEFDRNGEPVEPQPAPYDAGDAACDRYHYRKELQN